MTYIFDVVASVFRPSVAALCIAGAVAVVSVDQSSNTVGTMTVDVTDLSCSGLFKPFCQLVAN